MVNVVLPQRIYGSSALYSTREYFSSSQGKSLPILYQIIIELTQLNGTV
jgi:hypothetical protein